jgi:hypothetical protein
LTSSGDGGLLSAADDSVALRFARAVALGFDLAAVLRFREAIPNRMVKHRMPGKADQRARQARNLFDIPLS